MQFKFDRYARICVEINLFTSNRLDLSDHINRIGLKTSTVNFYPNYISLEAKAKNVYLGDDVPVYL